MSGEAPLRAARLLAFVAIGLVPAVTAGAQVGNPLGPEFRVNTYTTNIQDYPSVAGDGLGNFVVVWRSFGQDGSLDGLFGQRYAASGTPAGPEFRVNNYTSSTQSNPSVAVAGNGDFVAVFHGDDGVSFGVFARRFSGSGAPLGLGAFRVNSYTSSTESFPRVAADTAGNFVVTWLGFGQDGSSSGIFGQRFAASGATAGPEFRVNSYTTNTQNYPSVAHDGLGNFVIAWQSLDQDGSSYGIFGQRYAGSGAPLGPEFRVNTYATAGQTYPSVGADSAGNFVVVWTSLQQDGSNDGVFGQRYASSGVPLGPEFRVNTYTTADQESASVAADSSGNFVVVWSSLDQYKSVTGVFGQRFASSGIPLGSEFHVNSYTPGLQERPSVVADPAGNFVVVWESSGQDGSLHGVFGQRYSQILPVELMHFRVE